MRILPTSIFLLAAVRALAQPYSVATFQVDVTVPISHALMAGGIEPARQMVDPLYAQGIVLLGPEKPIVWCSVDWCEIRNDAYDAWRDALADAAHTDRERVLLAAIHQHDAPVVDLTAQRLLDGVGLEKSLCDAEFVLERIRKTAAAVATSLSAARRVSHYGVGTAEVRGIASNRRVVFEDGAVGYVRNSSAPDPAMRNAPVGRIDPTLRTLSFWNEDQPVAAISVYAVHPMSYYGRGGVSADFVGMARARRQSDTPEVLQMYFSGCSGDVVAAKYNDGTEPERAKLAERLYLAMAEAWNTTTKFPLGDLSFQSKKLSLPMRETEGFTEADQRSILEDSNAPAFQRNLAAMGLSWRMRHTIGQPIDVPTVDLGAAQFILLPAESFVEFQLTAQRIRPDSTVFVAGYGDSAPGYIPSRAATEEGFIESHSWCWVGPDAHEAMRGALVRSLHSQTDWGPLPPSDGPVRLPAQEWRHAPGPRTITAHIYYPRRDIKNVGARTGLMLTLHNWGGTGAIGAPDPEVLADKLNVVAIVVDYLQSGPYDPEADPPYDFGVYQALDALRPLYFVYSSLWNLNIAFDVRRIYATGGSGGASVALTAWKFAPRTFAAIVDLSGMARLSDDIAYGLPGGSPLNVGYNDDPTSLRYLSPDAQLLRDHTFAPHLNAISALGSTTKIISVHGVEDAVSPFRDKRDMVTAMQSAGIDVEPHFIDESHLDGVVFKDAGHSLGDRTGILLHTAGKYLDPDSPDCLRTSDANDFEQRDSAVSYAGPDVTYTIGYEAGYPVLREEMNSQYALYPVRE